MNSIALQRASGARTWCHARCRRARGVSLIEVLVAIVIFSLGLLGLALMQLKGSTFTKEASARTMATLQVSSLIDAMQANPGGVKAGDYVWSSATAPTPTYPCPAASLAACTATNDIAAWIAQVRAAAPPGSGVPAGTIAYNSTSGAYVARIWWNGIIATAGTSAPPANVSEAMMYMPVTGSTSGGP